ARQRLSPALDKDWDAYLERFAAHYQIDDQQRKSAEIKLVQSKDQAVDWLMRGSKDVEISLPSVTTKVKQTTPQRIQIYEAKLHQQGPVTTWPLGTRDMEDKELGAFSHDVEKQRLR